MMNSVESSPTRILDRSIHRKLDRLRVASNVCMLAAFISLFATAILSGLAGFRLLPPMVPFFSVGGFFVLLTTCIILDCAIRKVASENQINYDEYIRENLPPIPLDPKKKDKK